MEPAKISIIANGGERHYYRNNAPVYRGEPRWHKFEEDPTGVLKKVAVLTSSKYPFQVNGTNAGWFILNQGPGSVNLVSDGQEPVLLSAEQTYEFEKQSDKRCIAICLAG